MRKLFLALSFIVLSLLFTGALFAQEDVKAHPFCKYCGMDREKFAFSRVLIDYDDGTNVGTCSIHCAAIDLAIHIDKTPKAVWVGDYNTRGLTDVEKATWIIGGSKMGVMTKRAKWAFGKKEDAEKYKAENGGEFAAYDQVIKAAYEDMYQDTKMIRERRKMRRMEKK